MSWPKAWFESPSKIMSSHINYDEFSTIILIMSTLKSSTQFVPSSIKTSIKSIRFPNKRVNCWLLTFSQSTEEETEMLKLSFKHTMQLPHWHLDAHTMQHSHVEHDSVEDCVSSNLNYLFITSLWQSTFTKFTNIRSWYVVDNVKCSVINTGYTLTAIPNSSSTFLGDFVQSVQQNIHWNNYSHAKCYCSKYNS